VRAHGNVNQSRRKKPIVCYGCGHSGHFVKECPSSRSGARGVSQQTEPKETYVDIRLCGTHYSCLLDMGCERSLIPCKLVPKAKLKPINFKMYAANGTDIPILGSMRLGFSIQGINLYADLVVSDDVEEIMLGIDWLTHNECQWHFLEKEIEIKRATDTAKEPPFLGWYKTRPC